jgi:D-alanine-D-alanine ligase
MKKNIAIVMGGDSGEYEISMQSGEVVSRYLDPSKYNVYPVVIKGDQWYHRCTHNNEYEIDKNDFSLPMIGEKVKFDGVFIAIHGTPGEDGKLQGYFDMMGIPYTSCDHVISALTFNKHLTKLAVAKLDVLTADSVLLTASDKISTDEILSKLQLPVFVKPNNGGSSVGMSRVNEKDGLEEAIRRAFKEDEQVLVEAFIQGREITCGVIRQQGKVVAFPICEIVSKKEFFDFEAKYDPELADEIVPAEIPGEIFKTCQDRSVYLYNQLQCKGVVRFDYIYNDNGMYFLELNTVPGMTEASSVPKMAKAHGMSLEALFDTIMEEALG